jgi:hypothetical protein
VKWSDVYIRLLLELPREAVAQASA